MKAQPVRCENGTAWEPLVASEATHVQINLPIVGSLLLPVVTGTARRSGTGCWSWNGDKEKPTLKPSILNDPFSNGKTKGRSHCFVNDGMVRFLGDCSHELAGQTVPLLDVDKEFFRAGGDYE